MMILNPYRFAPSGGGGDSDPHWGSVVLLLHGDGTNGSRVYVDSSPYANTVLESGTNQITTAIKKFGTGSIDLAPSSMGYLSVANAAHLALGGADFCAEGWVYIKNTGVDAAMLRKGPTSAADMDIYIGPSLALRARCRNAAGVLIADLTHTTSLTASVWQHVAFTRSGSAFRLFLNGVKGAEVIGPTDAIKNSTAGLSMGTNTGGTSYFSGCIDELRLTIGAARYTANFTPPSSPFPNS